MSTQIFHDYNISPVPLSPAGLPILVDEGEVQIKFADSVILFVKEPSASNPKEVLPSGLFILTNVRFIIVCKTSDGSQVGWGLNLSDVTAVSDCSTFFKRSTRIKVVLTSIEGEIQLKLPLKQSEKEELISLIQKALTKRSWEHFKPKGKAIEPQDAVFSVTNAGVGGILRRQEENRKAIDSLTREAVVDLDALMSRARDVVNIVQRYASMAAVDEDGGVGGDSTGGSETTSQLGERSEIESILQTIGISSPVTKYSAGRLYHQQLARQLADFFLTQNRLKGLGGMITLSDAYCLFNRARGTELVSPDDFVQSSELLEKLHVGIAVKRFHSGVTTLRLDSVNEDIVCNQLLDYCKSTAEFQKYGIQASQVASRFQLSMIVAKEVLLLSEERGLLCRDDSVSGLAFFDNKFSLYV